MQLLVFISDFSETVNITEAGLDYFSISNSNTVVNEPITVDQILVHPNPNSGVFTIAGLSSANTIQIMDIQGRPIPCLLHNSDIELVHAQSGIYLVQIVHESGNSSIHKFVVE